MHTDSLPRTPNLFHVIFRVHTSHIQISQERRDTPSCHSPPNSHLCSTLPSRLRHAPQPASLKREDNSLSEPTRILHCVSKVLELRLAPPCASALPLRLLWPCRGFLDTPFASSMTGHQTKSGVCLSVLLLRMGLAAPTSRRWRFKSATTRLDRRSRATVQICTRR